MFRTPARIALVLAPLLACGGSPPPAAAPPPQAKVTSTPAVTPSSPKQPGEEDSPIPIAADDATWGNRAALVTIVEMTDLQCPFCARAHETMTRLQAAYGPEQLRIVWKHNPLSFHPLARPAAEWAQGVAQIGGPQAFACFVQKVFSEQRAISHEAFAGWANGCGVNEKSVASGVAAHTWAAKVDRDIALAGKLGANGTPTFFINGFEISGAQPYETFTRAIDDQISLAKELVEKGTPREALYVLVSAAIYKAQKEAKQNDDADEDEPKEDTTTVHKVPIGKSPQRGPATAPVTIVVFSDFQCPFCKRVEETLARVREKYGDRVRLVWKDEPLPFHPRAEPAAQLAREARAEKGDAGFWRAHDLLFEAQPKLEDDDLAAVAKKLGLDAAAARSAIASHRYKRELDIDADLADDFDANGTPHFFINGRRLVGAQPLEKFTTIIDAELAHAADVLAHGVKPAKLYEELTKDGKTVREPEKKTVAANANAPWRGSASATVTIQEFADFQCPFCADVESRVSELLKAYPGKVKLVWRQFPLPMHTDAFLAAQASAEAFKQKGSDGFWKMHDKLYAAQKTPEGLKRPALEKMAEELGLDMDKFKQALDSESHKAEIEADKKAANDAGIRGLPTFFINGYFVDGGQPLARFRKVIDRALSEAAKH